MKRNHIERGLDSFGTVAVESTAGEFVEFVQKADPVRVVEEAVAHSGRDMVVAGATALVSAHVVLIVVAAMIGLATAIRLVMATRRRIHRRRLQKRVGQPRDDGLGLS